MTQMPVYDERNDYCMLGLFEHIDNKIQLYVGVGWNINSPVPRLTMVDCTGMYLAGPYGYRYQVGNWWIYCHRILESPFLGRYQRYRPDEKAWVGRHHRAEEYNPGPGGYSE